VKHTKISSGSIKVQTDYHAPKEFEIIDWYLHLGFPLTDFKISELETHSGCQSEGLITRRSPVQIQAACYQSHLKLIPLLEALHDPATQEMVRTIINTGVEYEKTSVQDAHGIRSTPTMIINGRMIIGTLPYEQFQAIFQDFVDKYEGRTRFIEQWILPKARKVKQ
jgi:hypothetical protein